MNRANRHLLYSLLWLFGFIIIVTISSSWDLSDTGKNKFLSQVGSLVWVLGFAAIFLSWAWLDVIEHGKSKGAAAVFAVLWPFLIFIAHIAYLFYTRGLRKGFVATLKFVSFLLASAISVLVVGKLVGLVLS